MGGDSRRNGTYLTSRFDGLSQVLWADRALLVAIRRYFDSRAESDNAADPRATQSKAHTISATRQPWTVLTHASFFTVPSDLIHRFS